MSRSGREYLRHILDEADYLFRHARGLDRARFLDDETLQRAFVRSLEVIGEASKNLPDEVRQRHPEIDWRGMAGMRDRLIHAYFGVDFELVWDVIESRIPRLREELRKILHP